MRNVSATVVVILVMCIATIVSAGAYTSSPGTAIPDNNSGGVSDAITVTGEGTVSSLTIHLDITHSWVGDLIVDLTSPSGTTINLVDKIGTIAGLGCSNDNINVWLADGAAVSIEESCNSQDGGGTFAPMQSLATFAGEPANGTWTLSVRDNEAGDSGTLNTWTLELTTIPGAAVSIAPMTHFDDGRLNAYDFAAPVAVYPEDGGISVYSIDPETGDGVFTARLSSDDLQAASTGQAVASAALTVTLVDGSTQVIPVDPSVVAGLVGDLAGGNIQLFAGTHAFFNQPIFVHRLDSGEYQVTAYDQDGHIHTFIWSQ